MSDPVIQSLRARRIWDSRGRPTVEAEIILSDGAVGRGIAPAGASRGSREAVERRDGGSRLGGLDVQHALAGIRAEIAPALIGGDPFDQPGLDRNLVALDGTPTLIRLGGNALTAVSLATLHAAAASRRLPLWRHLLGDGAGAHSAAGNPDLRRRRPCRTADRHAGLHGRRVEGRELRRGAGSDG